MLPEYNVINLIVAILMAAVGLAMVMAAIYQLTMLILRRINTRREELKVAVQDITRRPDQVYTHIVGRKILFTKTADIDEAMDVLMLTDTGIYISTTGKDGPYKAVNPDWLP